MNKYPYYLKKIFFYRKKWRQKSPWSSSRATDFWGERIQKWVYQHQHHSFFFLSASHGLMDIFCFRSDALRCSRIGVFLWRIFYAPILQKLNTEKPSLKWEMILVQIYFILLKWTCSPYSLLGMPLHQPITHQQQHIDWSEEFSILIFLCV